MSLGIVAVRSGRGDLDRLRAEVLRDPSEEMTVDLVQMAVCVGDVTASVAMPESARDALVSGEWDFLAQLLDVESQIEQTASRLPYLSGFSG